MSLVVFCCNLSTLQQKPHDYGSSGCKNMVSQKCTVFIGPPCTVHTEQLCTLLYTFSDLCTRSGIVRSESWRHRKLHFSDGKISIKRIFSDGKISIKCINNFSCEFSYCTSCRKIISWNSLTQSICLSKETALHNVLRYNFALLSLNLRLKIPFLPTLFQPFCMKIFQLEVGSLGGAVAPTHHDATAQSISKTQLASIKSLLLSSCIQCNYIT